MENKNTIESHMEEFERQIMAAILRADDPQSTVLRLQYAAAQITSREFSGVGFFTYFHVPLDVPRVTPENLELGDHLHLEIDGLKDGVGVVLFVRRGVLYMLEGFTYTEPWPEWPVLKKLVIFPDTSRVD